MRNPGFKKVDLHVAGHTAGQWKGAFEPRQPGLRNPEGFYKAFVHRGRLSKCFASNFLAIFPSSLIGNVTHSINHLFRVSTDFQVRGCSTIRADHSCLVFAVLPFEGCFVLLLSAGRKTSLAQCLAIRKSW